jgi:microcystin-dependent protein
MPEPYLGEIRLFAGNFAPDGWAFCDGSVLAISQNDALFALIGTTFGGDGNVTFALPDLRGRVPIHAGPGPGLTRRTPGDSGGAETVSIQTADLPAHDHTFLASASAADQEAPAPDRVFAASTLVDAYANGNPNVGLANASVTAIGGTQPHDNVMPSACVNFIIALSGIYPPRS